MDKISEKFSPPINGATMKDFSIPPDYLEGYSWNNCKVELLLMPNYTIEINTYREHACAPPPSRFYDMPIPPYITY